MNDLNDMKTMWMELENRISSLERENRELARRVMNNDYKSAKERLVNKYKSFITLEIIMFVAVSLIIIDNSLIVEKYKTITMIYWALFLLGEASIDTYLMLKIQQIDVYNSNVTEISRLAARNWKIHKISILIGLPVAGGAIILFGLLINADRFAIAGMIVGGIVGLIVGGRQLIKFMKDYKELQTI